MPGHIADSCPTADRSRTTAQKTWTGGWAVEHAPDVGNFSFKFEHFTVFHFWVNGGLGQKDGHRKTGSNAQSGLFGDSHLIITQ